MAIAVSCPCGRQFEVDAGQAGQLVQCPACGVILQAGPFLPPLPQPMPSTPPPVTAVAAPAELPVGRRIAPWVVAVVAACAMLGFGVVAVILLALGFFLLRPVADTGVVSAPPRSAERALPPLPREPDIAPPVARAAPPNAPLNEQFSVQHFDLELLHGRSAREMTASLPNPQLAPVGPASLQDSLAAASLPPLPKERAALYEKVVQRFILYDVGMLSGQDGQRALNDFNSLRDDAIPALVRGINQAAYIRASCPVIVLASRIRQLLIQSEDVNKYGYVMENLGKDPPPNSRPQKLPAARPSPFARPPAGKSPTPQPITPLAIAPYHQHQLDSLRQFCEAYVKGQGPERAKVAITRLVEALQSKESSARRNAVMALAQRGPEARPAIPALLELLKDPDYEIANGAARALAEIGPEAQAPLIAALRSEHKQVRLLACLALGESKPGAEAAVAPLISRLKDGEQEVRGAAHHALGKLGRVAVPHLLQALKDPNTRLEAALTLGQLELLAQSALPTLLEQMKDPDKEARLAAHLALVLMGRTAVPALRQAVQDPNEKVWFSALVALGKIGPNADQAIPTLSACLAGEDKIVRLLAVDALLSVDPELPALAARRAESVPLFVEVLKHPETPMRGWSAACLGRLGPAAKSAAPALIVALKDPEAAVRASAAEALGQIKPNDAGATLALAGTLADPQGQVRAKSATALGQLGPPAKAAVPALIATQVDPDEAVQQAAHAALILLGETSVPGLVSAFKDPKDTVRHGSAAALARIGKPAVAELAGALKTPETRVRLLAAGTLQEIGPDAREALPTLAVVLTDADKPVRVQAVAALAAIDAPGSVPAFLERFGDADEEVRLAAHLAVVKVGKPAVPDLARALRADQPMVRALSAESLNKIGRDAREAIPSLVEALKDSDQQVRAGAAGAIGEIDPTAPATVRALLACFSDPVKEVRVAAHLSVVKLGKGGIPHLVQALGHPQAPVRKGAIETIKKVHTESHGAAEVQAAVPDLVLLLRDPNAEVQDEAAWALEELNPGFKPILPALRQALARPPAPVRLGSPDLRRDPQLIPIEDLAQGIVGEKGPRLKQLVAELEQRHGNQALLTLALACVHPEPDVQKTARPILVRYATQKPTDAVEKAATASLNLFKKLIDLGSPDRARERLLQLIKEQPRTQAAEEARRLLAKL